MVLKKIAFIGGDERCAFCAEMFAACGTECAVFGLEKSHEIKLATKCLALSDAIYGCDAIVLPLPVMKEPSLLYTPLSDDKILISELLSLTESRSVIFAGNPSRHFSDIFENLSLKNEVINYALLDTFSLLGSVPTAEGAACLAPALTGKTISGSTVLVAGCGKVGKQLSLLLKAMNAKVYVSARKPYDFAWIKANGMNMLKTNELCDCNVKFDIIFNTVPFMIFDKNVLLHLKGSPKILELASKPYGAGFNIRKAGQFTAFYFFLFF